MNVQINISIPVSLATDLVSRIRDAGMADVADKVAASVAVEQEFASLPVYAGFKVKLRRFEAVVWPAKGERQGKRYSVDMYPKGEMYITTIAKGKGYTRRTDLPRASITGKAVINAVQMAQAAAVPA